MGYDPKTGEITVAHLFNGWPPKPVISLYDMHGQLSFRTKKVKHFDLSDEATRWIDGLPLEIHLGISSRSKKFGKWTEKKLLTYESSIQYDLSFDGYFVGIKRVKRLGTSKGEEAIWRLQIDTA